MSSSSRNWIKREHLKRLQKNDAMQITLWESVIKAIATPQKKTNFKSTREKMEEKCSKITEVGCVVKRARKVKNNT